MLGCNVVTIYLSLWQEGVSPIKHDVIPLAVYLSSHWAALWARAHVTLYSLLYYGTTLLRNYSTMIYDICYCLHQFPEPMRTASHNTWFNTDSLRWDCVRICTSCRKRPVWKTWWVRNKALSGCILPISCHLSTNKRPRSVSIHFASNSY